MPSRLSRMMTLFVLSLPLAFSSVAGQEPPPVDIGIMTDRAPAQLSELFEQMRSEIIAVVGTGATIRLEESDLMAHDFNAERAEANYQTMLADDTDIIIAFGPVSAQVVAGRADYPKPTILFGGVNRDLLELPEPGTTSGIPNFTYLIAAESYENDLRTFEELYDFERVAFLMPPGQSQALDLDDRLPPLMQELGADFEIVDYDSPASVVPVLDRVDAVYLLDSIFIPEEEVRALAELLIDRRVPSFSGARRLDVELGLMATNQPREGLDSFFRRLALLIESVVAGEQLSDQPVFFDLNQTLTMNFHTSRAVGVPIRYSMITTTEFVGEFANPLAERVYTLDELVDEALRTNPGLESNRRNIRLAEQDRLGAWSAYLPNLEATVTQSIVDTDLAAAGTGNAQYSTDSRLSLSQTLLSPDAIAGISIQNSLLGAERERVRGAEWDLVVESATAYLTTLIRKANLEIQVRNLDVSKRNLQIARQNFEAGQTGRGDVLRLESEAAQVMQDVVAAVAALEQSFHAMNELVNAAVDREIDVFDVALEDGTFSDQDFQLIRTTLDDPSLAEPLEDWVTREAMLNSPELQVLDRNIDAAGRDASRNGLQRFIPTVAAGLDLNRNLAVSGIGAPPDGMGLTEYFTLGIVASVPLFDSNRRRIDRQTALIQRTQLQLQRSSTERLIERSARDVVQDLIRESASIDLAEISERAAVEALELTQAAYSSGAVTVVELIDAQRNLLSAELGRASATYTFIATAVRLQRLVGYFSVLRSQEENSVYIQRFLDYLQSLPAGDDR